MTTRSISVVVDTKNAGKFKIKMVTRHAKASKNETAAFHSGYLSQAAAEKDVIKLNQCYAEDNLNRVSSFETTLTGGAVGSRKKRRLEKPVLSGHAFKQHEKSMNKKFKQYKTEVGEGEGFTKDEWNDVYNIAIGPGRERALRAISLNVHLRDEYFLDANASKEKAVQLDGIMNGDEHLYEKHDLLLSYVCSCFSFI